MALADFFRRDAVAISQVLQGFQTDAFNGALEGVRVAIAFGEDAATSRDGRALLNLSVRLSARLYPSLTFVTVPAGDQFADELIGLASSINPNIEACKTGNANVGLSVGVDAPAVNVPTVYAGCDGWLARIGTEGPYATSDLGKPLWSWLRRLLRGRQPVPLPFSPCRFRLCSIPSFVSLPTPPLSPILRRLS